MVEEWVKDARNEVRLVDNLRVKNKKSLAAPESRNKELALKLAIANRDLRSAEAGLKTAEAQAEEQRQKLHYMEIELATAKQQVMELKAELGKDKKAAQVAQVTADAIGKKFYGLGMQEIEARLTDELARVCRDYCLEVWTEALNVAGASASSE